MRYLSIALRLTLAMACVGLSAPALAQLFDTSPADPARPTVFTISSPSLTGSYYVAAASVCRLVNANTSNHRLLCESRASHNTVDSINDIRVNFVDMAVVRSDMQQAAYSGTKDFAAYGAYTELRAILALHDDSSTPGLNATLVTSLHASDESVYQTVRTVFENLDELKALYPAFANLQPEQMIKQGLSIPLHEGAIRYYRERGWI